MGTEADGHEQPDRVPIDFGGRQPGTIFFGVHDRLKQTLGMSHENAAAVPAAVEEYHASH